jgi:hypothetical protein
MAFGKGLDVSHHNESGNWTAVAAAGMQIRLREGNRRRHSFRQTRC